MKRHDSSDPKRQFDEVEYSEAPEAGRADGGEWQDMEILKILMGADVEPDREFINSTCVEADENPSRYDPLSNSGTFNVNNT